MLMLLLGLGYNRYRLKQRSTQLLEDKQLLIDQKSIHGAKIRLERRTVDWKDWVLKEIHHRVKNNLLIITSLLDYKPSSWKSGLRFRPSANSEPGPVHGPIHQKLYQSERLSVIPIADYVSEIVDYLFKSYDRQDTVQKQFRWFPLNWTLHRPCL